MMSKNKVIFLTGHRKSGTTMLHKMFDGHTSAAVYPTDLALFYAYFPHFTKKYSEDIKELKKRITRLLTVTLSGDEISKFVSPEQVDKLIFEFFSRCKDKEHLVSRGCVLEALTLSWAKIFAPDRKRNIVVKETSQAVFFTSYLESCLDLKMINLIRDPRDNWAAIRSGVGEYYSSFGEGHYESLASLLNRLRVDMTSAQILQSNYSNRFKAVRFEDLVGNIEEVMREIASFSGMTFEKSLLKPTVNGENFSGNNYEGVKFQGASVRNVGRWKERISVEEAQIIEFWLCDMMQAWGYDLEFKRVDLLRSSSHFYEWYNDRYFYYDSFQ